MTATLAARIADRFSNASARLDDVRSGAAALAADPSTSATTWNDFAQRVASAEAQVEFWDTLQTIALRLATKGETIDEAKVAEICLAQIQNGAGDTWSGRGNDLARVRYDAKLDAVKDARYL